MPRANVPEPGSIRWSRILECLSGVPSPERWGEAVKALSCSGFHCGDNPRGWRANIDFLIQQSQRNKWLEMSQFASKRQDASADKVNSQVCSDCGAVAVVGPGTRQPDLSAVALCRGCFL